MKFSQRTDWPAAANPLTQRIEEKKKSGAPLIDLTESNPTRCGFNFLNEKWLHSFADAHNLSYSPDAHGFLEAREAVCAYYAEKKISVSPHQIFLTAGTSEAYSFILRLLCDARDRVMIPCPSYPLLDYLAALADVDTIRYFLSYEKNVWRISKESLGTAFMEKPKALILVNPNNPTGNFVKPETLELVNAMCRKSGVAILSDEVFLDFAFEPESIKPLSLAQNREVLTFTLSGISKILALPQMKLSWIVVSGPEALMKKAIEKLEIIADTYLSVNTPSQHALGTWLDGRDVVRREIRERLVSNHESLARKFQNDRDIQVLPCEGGWTAVIKIQSKKSDEELAQALLEEQNLITHPGYFFDFDEGIFLVLSLLLPSKIFKEGLDRLWDGLEKTS